MSDFDEIYHRKRPALERAEKQLRSLLVRVAASIEDRTLVRAEIDEIRVKDPDSLKRKARRVGWSDDDAFAQCPDIVGGRVVCNNVEDVYRFEELLRENLSFGQAHFERQDYIERPTERGYRALHLNIQLNVSEMFDLEFVPCEIQIRTRLQDAWAELSHSDIYKQEELPDDLRARAKDLADLLATADSIATSIRARVQQVTEPPAIRPSLDRVSVDALSFVFKDVFGRAPPDFIIREALNRCDEFSISSLTVFPAILRRNKFREKLAEAYQKFLPGVIPPETIFIAGLTALARGDRSAMRYVGRKARREFEEIDAIYRREMLSGLPESADDLIEALDDPRDEPDLVGMADVLGATHRCARCGCGLVDPYALAEAVARHYELSDAESVHVTERIEKAVWDSGADGEEGYCHYCAHHMARDD
jgi:ppGpp synthetase/RelA/SpoT-type nucleotidyltranferase